MTPSNIATVISGSGLFLPPHSISNDELVAAYNSYVEQHNHAHADAIARGEQAPLSPSSSEFIEKASGIQSRYVMYKEGMLDPNVMRPIFPVCLEGDEPEIVAMSLAAAKEAMQQANKQATDIDMVILTTSNHQRPYPSAAVEVQKKLGIEGFAFDMGIACSSTTFAIISAHAHIQAGLAKCVLVVNPEFTSPQLNLTSRDSHFIFGDVATAVIVESQSTCNSEHAFEVLSTKQHTEFSDNIRCDISYVDHNHPEALPDDRPFFRQQGKKVFKELLPMVTRFIEQQLNDNQLTTDDIKRMWLHQANINMNVFAAKKLLGRIPSNDEAPIVLNEFANTASAGSVIAFHRHKDGLKTGDIGLLCSFGAGYSIGGLVLRKC